MPWLPHQPGWVRALRVGWVPLVLAAVVLLPPAQATSVRTVVLVDKPFMCADYPQPLDLDLVKVTMTPNSSSSIQDAVHLTAGCAGRIGRVEVDTWLMDGIKVGSGAMDVVVGGGYIHCWDMS